MTDERKEGQQFKRASEYARSLGFIDCPWGCGSVVHPNPSNPKAAQAIWNHVCSRRLEEIIKGRMREAQPSPRGSEALREALEFYANPDTYFAIGIFPDPPAGDFMDDFSETELGMKPGKRARAALAAHRTSATPTQPNVEAISEVARGIAKDYLHSRVIYSEEPLVNLIVNRIDRLIRHSAAPWDSATPTKEALDRSGYWICFATAEEAQRAATILAAPVALTKEALSLCGCDIENGRCYGPMDSYRCASERPVAPTKEQVGPEPQAKWCCEGDESKLRHAKTCQYHEDNWKPTNESAAPSEPQPQRTPPHGETDFEYVEGQAVGLTEQPDWCDACSASQNVLPNGEHACGQPAPPQPEPRGSEALRVPDSLVIEVNAIALAGLNEPLWQTRNKIGDAIQLWLDAALAAATVERTPECPDCVEAERTSHGFMNKKCRKHRQPASPRYWNYEALPCAKCGGIHDGGCQPAPPQPDRKRDRD